MSNENWISYTPKDWIKGEVIREAHMDHIEEGILNATEKINFLKESIDEGFSDTIDRLNSLEAAARYEDMEIISFEIDKNGVYPSNNSTSVVVSWETNNEPASIKINNISVPQEELRKTGVMTLSISKPSYSSSTGWSNTIKIDATDEGSEGGIKSPTSAQAQISFNYKSKIYYGISTISDGLTSVQVRELEGAWEATTSRVRDGVSVNATAQNYIWFVFPKRLGTPTFRAGSSSSPAGGFIHNQTWDIIIENENGFEENYTLWRSNNLGLGSTTIWIS